MIALNATTKFHLSLNEASAAVIKKSTDDPAEIGNGQEYINQLDQWLKAIPNRPESIVLQNAISEAAFGEFLLLSGLYRPAFTALRLFLEMSLASVHFSANRLELAEWFQGKRDVVWASLIDKENGVLSKRYTDAFFPELGNSVQSYNATGSKVYRVLSEFVHGNSQTWDNSPNIIRFDRDLQTTWIKQLESASTVVMYALALRFLKEIDLRQVPDLASTIQSSLGNIEALRDFLNKGE